MDAKQDGQKIGANEKESHVSKKVYTEPKLTVHGKVEDITKAVSIGGGADSPYGSM